MVGSSTFVLQAHMSLDSCMDPSIKWPCVKSDQVGNQFNMKPFRAMIWIFILLASINPIHIFCKKIIYNLKFTD